AGRMARKVWSVGRVSSAAARSGAVPFIATSRKICGGTMQKIECRWCVRWHMQLGSPFCIGVTQLGGLEGKALQRTPLSAQVWRQSRHTWAEVKLLGACGPGYPFG